MTEVHFSKCCLTFSPRNSWSGKRSMNFVYLQNISAVAESLRNVSCLVSMMRGVRRFWLGLKIFSMKAVKWILRRIFMKCCSTPRFTTWIDFFNFFSFSDNVVCRPTYCNICELSPWSRWLVFRRPKSFSVALEAFWRWMDGSHEWKMTTWKFWWQCGREVWKWRSRGGTTTLFVIRRKAFLLNKCERVKHRRCSQASKMFVIQTKLKVDISTIFLWGNRNGKMWLCREEKDAKINKYEHHFSQMQKLFVSKQSPQMNA